MMFDEREPVDIRCSVLVLRAGSVLLCRRAGLGNIWVLPGGTPRKGEGVTAAAVREVAEETGLRVNVQRVAFVLETTSWDRAHHLVEIVFLGDEENQRAGPVQRESGLAPSFVALDNLDEVELKPPMAGYIRGFARRLSARPGDEALSTAAWLGNLWRSEDNR